jgi:glycosyltransferase involved in cell wall biosynthesis
MDPHRSGRGYTPAPVSDAAQPTFTVIVPTAGRSTLGDALASAASQLQPGDEIIAICNRDLDLGAKARNNAMARAQGTHLLFLDDDDEYLPGAFDKFRAFAIEHPTSIGIFRERLVDGSLHWGKPEFRIGNVGTVLFVVPNVPEQLGVWDAYHGEWAPTDWVFISATAERMGDPVFVDEVVAVQRPGGTFATSLDRLRYRWQLGRRLRAVLHRGR